MDDARWLEVSLTLNSELAEAVAEVLGRFIPNGVVIESSVAFLNEDDTGTPLDTVRVYGYIPIDEHIEQTRQRLNEALWHLSQIQPLPEPAYRPLHDQDWMTAWKQHYHPIPIGSKLLILPAWIEQQDAARIPVRIDPGMAFGTGTHPSTQLCLEMLETYVHPGQSIIDIGCGSGILSIAAIKLGCRHALAVDIDPAALRGTRENAAANGVEQQIEVGQGSLQDILNGCFSIRRAPLVLANILAPILTEMLEQGLERTLLPEGTLILAGILDEQTHRIDASAQRAGLRLTEKCQISDWVALAYQTR